MEPQMLRGKVLERGWMPSDWERLRTTQDPLLRKWMGPLEHRPELVKWEKLCTQDPLLRMGQGIGRQELAPNLAKWEALYSQESPWQRLAQLPIGARAGVGDIERDPARRWLHGEFSKVDRLSIFPGPFDSKPEPPPGATLSALLSAVTGFRRSPELPSQRAAHQTGAKRPPLPDAVRLRPNLGYFRTHPKKVLARKLFLHLLHERDIDPPPGPVGAARLEPLYAREAGAVGENNPTPQLSRAAKVDVHDAITAVYAAAIGEKPPNVKELVPPVKGELRAKNLTASWTIIQECAKDPRHAGKRWLQGETRKSKQIRRADE
jgi:hypothetical protein